jgi:hypothetical protein
MRSSHVLRNNAKSYEASHGANPRNPTLPKGRAAADSSRNLRVLSVR